MEKIKKWIEDHKYKIPDDVKKVWIVNDESYWDYVMPSIFGFMFKLMLFLAFLDVFMQRVPVWCAIIN